MNRSKLSTKYLQVISLAVIVINPLQAMYFCNNPQHKKNAKLFNKRWVYRNVITQDRYIFSDKIEEDSMQHRKAYLQYLRGHKDETLLALEQLKSLEQMPGS